MRIRRIPAAAVLAAAALMTTACGGSEAPPPAEESPAAEPTEESPAAEPTEESPAAEPTEESPPAAEPTVKCKAVGQDLLDAIATGAQDGTGLEPVQGAAYRSPNFEKVWFVAMEFSATGIPNQTGVWATNSLKPGQGLILAADGFAKEFTDWPDAETTDAAISPADPGISTAQDCLS